MRRAPHLLALILLALLPHPVAADGSTAALAAYPQPRPQPVGSSILPQFVDLDETVVLTASPDLAPRHAVDDVLLRIRGSGDFVVRLPGPAISVDDYGTAAKPQVVDGHVVFQGHVEGTATIGGAATIALAQATAGLPVSVAIRYTRDGRAVDPLRPGAGGGHYAASLTVTNLTARPLTVLTGRPSGDAGTQALQQALSALRGVGVVYTPELDLSTVFPLPPGIPLDGAQPVPITTYIPLRVTVSVRLPRGVRVTDAGGGASGPNGQGTKLVWTPRLPAEPSGSSGTTTLSWAYDAPDLELPGVEMKVEALPMPAAFFPATDPVERQVLAAQAGAASIHRITELTPPLDRPGAGPQRVSYDIVAAPVSAQQAAAPPPARPVPQPWAILLALVVAALVGVTAWWAWSRN